tara:strand:- start:2687 stop:2809 length:123 start_codon:yes stop_codon:yes gene_type:complete
MVAPYEPNAVWNKKKRGTYSRIFLSPTKLTEIIYPLLPPF